MLHPSARLTAPIGRRGEARTPGSPAPALESRSRRRHPPARAEPRTPLPPFAALRAFHAAVDSTPGRIALPVAGDDAAAKAVVLRLVDELGFDGVDAGGLDESWRQQPGTPVYARSFDADGVRRALAEARRERGPEWRATPDSRGSFAAPA